MALRTIARSYEKEIADFRANPAAYAEESSSEESDSSDDSSSDDESSSSSAEDSDSDSEDGSDDSAEEGGSDDDSDDSDEAGGGATSRAAGAAKASKPIKTQKVRMRRLFFRLPFFRSVLDFGGNGRDSVGEYAWRVNLLLCLVDRGGERALLCMGPRRACG